jgi:hypothetical protein
LKGLAMDILIDFLNMDPDLESLRAALIRWEGKIKAMEPSGFFKMFHNRVDFRNEGGPEFCLKEYQRESDSIHGRYDPTIYLDDKEFPKLWEWIGEMKDGFKAFINGCRDGALDYEFLNHLFVCAMFNRQKFVPSAHPLRPTLILFEPGPDDFYGLVAVDVLNDFLQGRGEDYKRICPCSNCGKYTAGRSTKRVFCSIFCRNQLHYKNRKNPPSEEA